MGIKTLKTLRMLVPGLMIVFALIALKGRDWESLTDTIAGIEISQDSFKFYIIPLVLGVLYYLADFRNVFFRRPIRRITNNIYTRLITPFENHNVLGSCIDQLQVDPKVKQVFYKFIDNEPDLREKANNVRMNGLILSSLADAAILCLIFAPIYLGFYIWQSAIYYLYLTIIVLVCFLAIHFILLPAATRKHLKYSNEQIDSILANKHSDLEAALLALVGYNNAS